MSSALTGLSSAIAASTPILISRAASSIDMGRRVQHGRVHDYQYLIRRWRAIAVKCGLVLKKYGKASGYDLYFLRSKVVTADAPAIYLSAGIHGDEPGATEGLLTWAEKNTALIKKLNFLIFPCLNPWGLVFNSRYDSEGHDLNRSYHNQSIPQIAAQMALFTHDKFDLAAMLHEDYDAQGVYLYEIQELRPYWGEDLIAASSRIIPGDPRKKIEGRAARSGVIRRKVNSVMMPTWPEAFVLYFQQVKRVFTVETPSEYLIDDRANAHAALLTKLVSLCQQEFQTKGR
jgi:murein peptide amidase A